LNLIENASFIGGEELDTFKDNFAAKYGVSHCIPVANGTDALFIAIKMLGIQPGDEVITTAMSWISTAETISLAGAKPVFVDVDDYYTIDATKIEAAITEKTRAIIPVHLYGQSADMEAINSLAKKYDLKIIEDCAQSHFSKFKEINVGLWGDIATFSFYPGKNLGAYGDAGAIITKDETLATQCKMFANHGALKKHEHLIEGINSRMDTIQAGVLNVTVEEDLDANTAPTTGRVYANALPVAYGYVSSGTASATLVTDYGVSTITKPASTTGVYQITLDKTISGNPVIIGTSYNASPGDEIVTANRLSSTEIEINIVDGAGNAVNSNFYFVVFGDAQ
jgi:hypothetical protein